MSDVVAWTALAPLLALVGAVVNGLFGRSLRGVAAGVIGSVAVGAGFLLSLLGFFALLGREDRTVVVDLWDYLSAGPFDLSLGFHIDELSILMMLIITGVGLLIHVYSIGYMAGDEGFPRYFMGLNLFVAAMLVLVMADSFLLMFVGWEGVGVCSYLLIGFWYTREENANAARKAFIVNRIGDVGFLLAMFLTVATFGTLNIAEVNAAAMNLVFGSATLTWLALLYLLGATGKSAQLPLQVWLPDAMAGPTPVSALIHAATMVTAGVYLIARAAPLFASAPDASAAVAWIGALTALIAAFAALAQTDIKRILAYSTVSQLGFMFAAVGVGAYWAGIFHVFTHAFFKALLFMGAGSAIHALHGEQDVRKMGGLRKHMRVTAVTSLIATLAIAGVPFLAGFFSKDAILAATFNSMLAEDYGGKVLYAILLGTAVLTAFYMFRWYWVVFEGRERFRADAAARPGGTRPHESPPVMTVPLAILAFFSVAAGYLGLPEFLTYNGIAHWLEPATLGDLAQVEFHHPSLAVEWLLVLLSVVAAAAGIGIAWWIYSVRDGAPAVRLGDTALARLSRAGAGFDALYRAIFVAPSEGTAGGLAVLDRDMVDRSLSGSVTAMGLIGRVAAAWQSGYARLYAFSMLLGLIALIAIVALVGVF